MSAHIFSLHQSNGGVPKLPLHEAAVGPLGITNDKQNDTKHHGGPDKALCLYSLERIVALQREGHPIYPGSTGENVTITGLDWAMLKPGDRLHLGDVLVEITYDATPCKKIAGSFRAGEFTRIGQKVHQGWARLYARVLAGGTLRVGQPVAVEQGAAIMK